MYILATWGPSAQWGLTLRCTRLATAGFASLREPMNSNVRPHQQASTTIQRMTETVSTQASDHLRDLELLRTRALVERDMAVIERLHAPEYQLITPSGTVFSRERYLAALASGPFYSKWEVGIIDVRLSAEMALLRY